MKKINLLHLSTILLAVSIFLGACSIAKKANSSAQTVTPTNTFPAPTNTPTVLASDTPTISPVATTPISIIQVTNIQDKAHYISETYPDGSNVDTGASFDKTWRLQNAGTTTWTTDYAIAYITSSPSNEKLGSPDTIRLSQAVKPGESIDITVKLTAPQTTGSYKVTWRFLNPQGQIVSVDGYDLWALINVGNVQAISSSGGSISQSVTASGVRIDLTNITYDKPLSIWSEGLINSPDSFYSTSGVIFEYCIDFPDLTSWSPQSITLTMNGQSTNGDYRFKDIKDPATFTNSYRCFVSAFTNTIPAGENFSFSIGLIGKDGMLDEDCPAAQQVLITQYPDLKFTCRPLDGGALYTLTKQPNGMSDQEADRIIADAIQKNIYGNWSFNITR